MVNLNIKEYIADQISHQVNKNTFGAKLNALCEHVACLKEEVKANNIGMNNVYNEFSKVTDGSFIRDWEKEKQSLELKMKQMINELDEIRKYVNKCYSKISAINSLYSLRDTDDQVISKIAKIVDIIGDNDR